MGPGNRDFLSGVKEKYPVMYMIGFDLLRMHYVGLVHPDKTQELQFGGNLL